MGGRVPRSAPRVAIDFKPNFYRRRTRQMAMYVVNGYVRRKTNTSITGTATAVFASSRRSTMYSSRPAPPLRWRPIRALPWLRARPGRTPGPAPPPRPPSRRPSPPPACEWAVGGGMGRGEQGVGELGWLPRRSTHPRTPRAPRITHTRTSNTANCAAPKCPPDRCTSSRSSFFFSSRARTACATNTFSRAASCGASRPSSSSLTPTQGRARTL